jgi:hypothetical protein
MGNGKYKCICNNDTFLLRFIKTGSRRNRFEVYSVVTALSVPYIYNKHGFLYLNISNFELAFVSTAAIFS